MNTMMKRLLALTACALLLVAMVAGCGKDKGKKEPATVLSSCTITIKTEGGSPMENVGVSVYADKDKTELIDFARTNADGVYDADFKDVDENK